MIKAITGTIITLAVIGYAAITLAMAALQPLLQLR